MLRTRRRTWTTSSSTRVRRAGELVTGFQRTPIALRVGSPIAPVPGLVSTVLVCKRADDERDETGRPVGLASRSSAAHAQAVCIAADIRDVRPRDVGERQVRITQATERQTWIAGECHPAACWVGASWERRHTWYRMGTGLVTAAWHVWVWRVSGCPLPVLQTTGLRRLPAGETRGHVGGMVSPPPRPGLCLKSQI
jgi:hypothetical protein